MESKPVQVVISMLDIFSGSDKKSVIIQIIQIDIIHSLVAMSSDLMFHPLEVVSRYRDPQLQVGENYSYLFILKPNI